MEPHSLPLAGHCPPTEGRTASLSLRILSGPIFHHWPAFVFPLRGEQTPYLCESCEAPVAFLCVELFRHEPQVEKRPSASRIHQLEHLAKLRIDRLLWYVYIVGSCFVPQERNPLDSRAEASKRIVRARYTRSRLNSKKDPQLVKCISENF